MTRRTPWRRCLTVPGYLLACALVVAMTPGMLLPLAVIDAIRRRRFPLVRAWLFGAIYLVCESWGILASFLIWFVHIGRRGGPGDGYANTHYSLQRLWAATLFRSVEWIYGLRLVIEGDHPDGRGPIVLLVRHASLPDVILPSILYLVPRRLRVRHVMKRELLWDPCLDIVGHRIPNVFIDRQGDSEEEIARVGSLGRNLAPDEAVMIYPEGTRFSNSKKERIVRRCEARGDAVSAAYARSLRHVLPPRMGGALALLDAANGADVVFCAHKGFESTRRAVDFLNGSLIDATIRVRLWRVPASELPEGAKALAAWLLDRWKDLDGWIDRAPDGGMAS